MSQVAQIEFSEVFAPLFQPNRYKIMYGGRGSGKSWAVARALVILSGQQKLRILCTREFQNSIDESVHKLLSNQIDELGLMDAFTIQRTSITCNATGSEFIFMGLRHNIKSVKSIEGVDICWVEEAQTVTKSSWDILIPTIRKGGSEIWVTFNPELEEDATYQRFVKNPPEGAWVQRVNYHDNPWFPDVLQAEMEQCRDRSESEFRNIWLGECLQQLEGSYYAEYLAKAEEQGRVGVVPHDPALKVNTAWDLGIGDDTAIFFFQQAPGGQVRIIDYYESRGVGLEHYARVLDEKAKSGDWIYDYHILPHDVEVRELGTGKSRFEMLRSLGIHPTIAKRLPVDDGIAAVRRLFPSIWINTQTCEQAIHSIRRYRREFDEKRNVFYEKPRHDEHSHCADALRYLAVGLRQSFSTGPIKRGLKGIV